MGLSNSTTQKALYSITQSRAVRGENASLSGNTVNIDNSQVGNMDVSTCVKVSTSCAIETHNKAISKSTMEGFAKLKHKQRGLQLELAHVQNAKSSSESLKISLLTKENQLSWTRTH